MELIQKIHKLREQILQIKEEVNWLKTAPLSREEFKGQVLKWFEHMSAGAAEADNRFLSLRFPDQAISLVDPLKVEYPLTLPVVGRVVSSLMKFSITPQLLWLLGDTIKASLLAKVEAMEYVPGLPRAERVKRCEQLTTQLHTLEVKEEELICEAELANLPIYRRADADPAVVLNYDPEGDMGAPGLQQVSINMHAATITPAAP